MAAPRAELVEFVSDEFKIGTPQCRELLVSSFGSQI